MVLTNHIIRNVIGSVFHHFPRIGEGNNIRVKGINLYQSIELIESNQGMGLIKSIKDIQL